MLKKRYLIFILLLGIASIIIKVYLFPSQVQESKSHITKVYSIYLFKSSNTLIETNNIKLDGTLYKDSKHRDNFIGTITFQGISTSINTLSLDKKAIFSEIDERNFYPIGNSEKLNSGLSKINTFIAVSKDFTTIYGYTNDIRKSYGKKSYFKSNKNLKTFLD
ncbi:MAG: hypothetical protein Q8942_16615 [Bacillota bacterium]|nr:hypothetical protein [Bacillota bacterium]